MDRVQRNGGTAGLITAVLLAVLFVLILSLGQDAMTPDPAKSLPAVTQKWNLFAFANVIGLLATAFAVPFVVGLATRLREAAPTRSRTLLYLTLIGLGGYALGSSMMWLGGHRIVVHASTDQAAATQAWLTLSAVHAGLRAVGSSFAGAGAAIAGWAIVSTGAMASGIGWLGVVTGVVGVLTLFARGSPVVFFGSFILTIAWLAWAGSALRGTKTT